MSSEAYRPRPRLVSIPGGEEPGSEGTAQELAQREDLLRELWLSAFRDVEVAPGPPRARPAPSEAPPHVAMAAQPPRREPDGPGKWLALVVSGLLAGGGLGIMVAASLTIVPRSGSEFSALLRDAQDFFRSPLASSLTAESLAQPSTTLVMPAPASVPAEAAPRPLQPEPAPVTAAPAPERPAARVEAPHPIIAVPPPPAPSSPEPEPIRATAATAPPAPPAMEPAPESVVAVPAPALPAPERAAPRPEPEDPRFIAAPPAASIPALAMPALEKKLLQSPAPVAPKPEPSLAIAPPEPQPSPVVAVPVPEAAAPEPAVAVPAADPGAFRRALATIKAQMDEKTGAPPAMLSLPEPPHQASPQP